MKKFTIAVLSLALTTGALADTSPEHRETVARQLVAAINSADSASETAFLKSRYINADSAAAIERWRGHFAVYRERFGKLTLHSVDADDDFTAYALCQTSSPRSVHEWLNLEVNFDSLVTDKYRTMGGGSGQDPNVTLPDRALTDPEIVELLDSYVKRMVERDAFSGTVTLTKNGAELYSGAYGFADLRWRIPNTMDTKFNLGSMNKMFTGVAICQLVAQEKLSFDDPIGKYLPDYPNPEAAEKVTIHHLLTHTSGMGSYWDAMSEMDWTTLRSVRDFAELTWEDSLEFEPGAEFHYSNSGPLVLGLVIEAISGMDYHDYIREHVTGPAGMENTDCYQVDMIVPNLAQGYYWGPPGEDLRRANIFVHSARGSAAGGGFSTAPDLQKFAAALYNNTLLPPEMVEILTTGKVQDGPEDMYAYLFADSRWSGHRTVGHGGGAPGINADLKIFTDLGYVITVMSNYDRAANAVSTYATRLITHKRPGPDAG